MAEEWKKEWSVESYEWPVTPSPSAAVVERLGKQAITRGGRAAKEAHADRGVVMDFPNTAVPGSRIRAQVTRAECRRRAQIMVPTAESDPLRVCVVCDSVHLWPRFQEATAES